MFGVNKLLTATEPLAKFLKLVAAWSALRNVHLAVLHVTGEKNTWADKLRCNKLHRFLRRSHEREGIAPVSLASPHGMVTLHPLRAVWPDSLVAVQQKSRHGKREAACLRCLSA